MKYLEENITQTLNEEYLVEMLHLNNKTILELGCGAAQKTKLMAKQGNNRKIIAYEVDEIQHEKNLQIIDSSIEFRLGGAQEINLPDNSVEFVFMFKSFHHIPKDLMPQALNEIKRVLKPNGLVYISEPLFLGDQNYLVSLFHDESEVRLNAFNAIKDYVENEHMKLFREVFFQTEVLYNNFADFEKLQMNQSYNDDKINKDLYAKVQSEYKRFANEKGEAFFLKPFRVDILQKDV